MHEEGLRPASDIQCLASGRASLSFSVLTATFPDGPGLAGSIMSPFWILLEIRMMEVVMTTGAITTNKPTPSFYRPDSLPVAQPTMSGH